ncbi:hypothetical protein J3459_016692 [Metarhizium acridum]|nr:hypothetical protein J3459_016692 [Metarhizium acridum]
MTPSKRLVVVLGATGSQGGAVVEYLLAHSPSLFQVRAVVRNADSEKAKALAKLGAELSEANFDDEDALRRALHGADAIFCLTNFFDQNSVDSELYRGLNIAKVASEIPELENFVFSALPDARDLFGGEYQRNLPYNAKSYIKEGIQKGFPELWKKTTVLYLAYYHQNWLKYAAVFGPAKQPDGSFILRMPHPGSDPVSMASSLDTGAVVDAILRAESKYHGHTVALVAERLSDEKKLAIWAEALGVKAVYQQVTPAEYKKGLQAAGVPVALAHGLTELAEVIARKEDYVQAPGVIRGEDIIERNYKLKTWQQYVKEEDWSSLL